MMKIGEVDMNLISEEMMDAFSAWAEENEDKHIFSEISKGEASYYINRDSEKTYMMEYSPQTVSEIKKALEEYSGISDPNMLKRMTVAICQSRFKGGQEVYEDVGQMRRKKQSDGRALPEFIYIF